MTKFRTRRTDGKVYPLAKRKQDPPPAQLPMVEVLYAPDPENNSRQRGVKVMRTDEEATPKVHGCPEYPPTTAP